MPALLQVAGGAGAAIGPGLMLRLCLPLALAAGAYALGDRRGHGRAAESCAAARAAGLEAQSAADRRDLEAAASAARALLEADYQARLGEALARADARAEMETELARLRREIEHADPDPSCPEPGLAGERLRIARDAASAANRVVRAADGAGDGAGGGRAAGP